MEQGKAVMLGRIIILACIFACTAGTTTVFALDGTGSGTIEEKITIKGCENGLEIDQVTGFAIGTLGSWSMSTASAELAGIYTKKKKSFNLEMDTSSQDTLVDRVASAANQLCGVTPGTLAVSDAGIKKFTAKLAKTRDALSLKLVMALTVTDGEKTYKPKYNLVADLAFTPTGGGIGGKIGGQVLAPDGQIAATGSQDLLASIAEFFLSPARSAVTGLSPVPKGTPVELVHLGVTGAVDGVLATTNVGKKGKYRFDLDRLGHYDAPDLAVRLSERGVQMRAFLTDSTVDITPVSEAVFQLVIDSMMATPGALLANYTFDEIDDLGASVDLLTTLKGLPAEPGVDATVAAIKDLVALDPGISNYLMAAADAGQTDVGPGDIGNLFPLGEENSWTYGVTSSEYQQIYTEQTTVTGSMEVNGTTAMVLNYEYPFGQETSYDEFLEKNSTGLYNWGNTLSDDFITPAVAPYQQEAFPLKLGSSTEIINRTGLEWGEDLDYDGLNERFDVSATINTIGVEAVSVPVGNFPLAVKQDILIRVDVTLSHSGKHAKATDLLTQWLVSDIGPVKVNHKTSVSAFGKTSTVTITQLLERYRVDGQSGGNLPVTTYGCANTNISCTLQELFDGGYFEVEYLRFHDWAFVSSTYTTPTAPDPSLMDVEIYDSRYLDNRYGLQGEGPGFSINDGDGIHGSEHRDLRYAFQVSTVDADHVLNNNSLQMGSLSYGGGNAPIAGGRVEVNERVTDGQGMELATNNIFDDVIGKQNYKDFAKFSSQPTILVETGLLEEGSPLNDESTHINLRSYWQRFGYTASPVP